MKYSTSITINAPRDFVAPRFADESKLVKWQKGLVAVEPIEGHYGEKGYSGKLKFQMGSREMEMIEVVEQNDLPKLHVTTYTTRGVFNRVITRFDELEGGRTVCVTEHEFNFSSFGMKMFGLLMPGAFRKQSKKYLEDFKSFVEGEFSDQNGE